MKLRDYLDKIGKDDATQLAQHLGISYVYLLQLAAKQGGRQPKAGMCVQIERLTRGAVSRLELRDDAEAIWPEMLKPDVKVA